MPEGSDSVKVNRWTAGDIFLEKLISVKTNCERLWLEVRSGNVELFPAFLGELENYWRNVRSYATVGKTASRVEEADKYRELTQYYLSELDQANSSVARFNIQEDLRQKRIATARQRFVHNAGKLLDLVSQIATEEELFTFLGTQHARMNKAQRAAGVPVSPALKVA